MKTFVLDTNVLIHDPDSIFAFEDNKVVIPMAVIEELDGLKHGSDERGQNVRSITRKLSALRSRGKLSENIKLDGGGLLKIELDHMVKLPYEFVSPKTDHRIIGLAMELQQKGEKVIFISKDINLRIKAEALGIETQDYEKSKIKIEELYRGWTEITVPSKAIDVFYKDKQLKPEKSFYPNEGVILKDDANPSKSALAKYDPQKKMLTPLFHMNVNPWGVKPLNLEQRFAIELLLCNEVKLVTLIGVPGAGKTLLSLACGLQKTLEENLFRKLFIARPIVPMGNDLGYLPGTKEEKLNSWMGAIYDNLEFLLHNHAGQKCDDDDSVGYFMSTGKLEIEALTYIRGRSLPEQFIIIDDAQNLTPHEIKTIISRAGMNTKIVLTGDPYQIDNPYLDAASNGLTYLVEHFKGQEMFGHINFTKTERSKLAQLAGELL
jgi:PhoH-like ATPase